MRENVGPIHFIVMQNVNKLLHEDRVKFGFDKPWRSKSHWREESKTQRIGSAGTKRKTMDKERKSRERSKEPKDERRLGSWKWSTSRTRKEGSGK